MYLGNKNEQEIVKTIPVEVKRALYSMCSRDGFDVFLTDNGMFSPYKDGYLYREGQPIRFFTTLERMNTYLVKTNQKTVQMPFTNRIHGEETYGDAQGNVWTETHP